MRSSCLFFYTPRYIVTDRDIHDAYDFCGPVLGKGSFATVLRVRDRMSGSEYAVKQVRSDAGVYLHDIPSEYSVCTN